MLAEALGRLLHDLGLTVVATACEPDALLAQLADGAVDVLVLDAGFHPISGPLVTLERIRATAPDLLPWAPVPGPGPTDGNSDPSKTPAQNAQLNYDVMAVNSAFVQRRVQKYYGRDSTIIYPPVDTERFRVGD